MIEVPIMSGEPLGRRAKFMINSRANTAPAPEQDSTLLQIIINILRQSLLVVLVRWPADSWPSINMKWQTGGLLPDFGPTASLARHYGTCSALALSDLLAN